MKKLVCFVLAACAGLVLLTAQDIRVRVNKEAQPAIAIPDLRGSGAAQNLMGAFNQTLGSDPDAFPPSALRLNSQQLE